MSRPLLKTRGNIDRVKELLAPLKQRKREQGTHYYQTLQAQWKRADTGEPMTKLGIEHYICENLQNPCVWLSLSETGTAGHISSAAQRDLTCERFNQYLESLAYTCEERAHIFRELHKLNPVIVFPRVSSPQPHQQSYRGSH